MYRYQETPVRIAELREIRQDVDRLRLDYLVHYDLTPHLRRVFGWKKRRDQPEQLKAAKRRFSRDNAALEAWVEANLYADHLTNMEIWEEQFARIDKALEQKLELLHATQVAWEAEDITEKALAE